MLALQLPALFINFKTYESGTGLKALEVAKSAEWVAFSKKKTIAIVSQACDIRLLSENCRIPIFAQHIDPITYGAHTGSILPEAVKEAGAIGAVLNHAENKRPDDFVEAAIKRAKEVNLLVMVCAESLDRAIRIASYQTKPDLIAIEPPELISGNISVSEARPELITDVIKAVNSISKIPIIAGAGIKNSSDVKKALELGCAGVFVSSGVMNAQNKENAMIELLSGFK